MDIDFCAGHENAPSYVCTCWMGLLWSWFMYWHICTGPCSHLLGGSGWQNAAAISFTAVSSYCPVYQKACGLSEYLWKLPYFDVENPKLIKKWFLFMPWLQEHSLKLFSFLKWAQFCLKPLYSIALLIRCPFVLKQFGGLMMCQCDFQERHQTSAMGVPCSGAPFISHDQKWNSVKCQHA